MTKKTATRLAKIIFHVAYERLRFQHLEKSEWLALKDPVIKGNSLGILCNFRPGEK